MVTRQTSKHGGGDRFLTTTSFRRNSATFCAHTREVVKPKPRHTVHPVKQTKVKMVKAKAPPKENVSLQKSVRMGGAVVTQKMARRASGPALKPSKYVKSKKKRRGRKVKGKDRAHSSTKLLPAPNMHLLDSVGDARCVRRTWERLRAKWGRQTAKFHHSRIPR